MTIGWNVVMHRTNHRVISKALYMLLAVIFLMGSLTPAMAVVCDCPCCGSLFDGHLAITPQTDQVQKTPSGGHDGHECNHCTLNPYENQEKTAIAPLVSSNPADSHARSIWVVQSPCFDLFYANHKAPDFQARTGSRAPVYLQIMSIRC